MALQSTIQISINGEIIPAFQSFTLKEKIGNHAEFSLQLRNDVIERFPGTNKLLDTSKDFLGGSFIIQISSIGSYSGYKNLEFKGIVTNVDDSQGFFQDVGDIIHINGHSSSILLDDAPHMNSFSELSLSEIIQNVVNRYSSSHLGISIQPETDINLLYTVQNKESGFEFLQRMAASYGEYLIYNQDTLYFGKPKLGNDIPLVYGHDLQNFSIGITTKNSKRRYFSSNYYTDESAESNAQGGGTTNQGYVSYANNASEQLFLNDTNLYYTSYDNSQIQQHLDRLALIQHKVIQQQQVMISGVSDNPGVGLGKIIDIKNASSSYGRFRVIEISHEATETGKYHNSFKAIPIDIDMYPLTNIHTYPKSEVQIGKVVDNTDEEGMSRIKVQFPWQRSSGEMTPWLRMTTLYAGSEKGIHFIPEIGEQVLVGFENGNAEKPFVQGALYSGTQKYGAWQSESNNFKGITTKSGHTIELNDTKDGEMITITDKNRNSICIDTKNNSIEVSAIEKMTLNAKNIEINAQEELQLNAGTNILGRATEDLSLTCKNSTENVAENKTMISKELLSNSEKVRIESSKQNLELVSSKQVDVQANDKIKLF